MKCNSFFYWLLYLPCSGLKDQKNGSDAENETGIKSYYVYIDTDMYMLNIWLALLTYRVEKMVIDGL